MLTRATQRQKQQSSDSPVRGELLLCCFLQCENNQDCLMNRNIHFGDSPYCTLV